MEGRGGEGRGGETRSAGERNGKEYKRVKGRVCSRRLSKSMRVCVHIT